MTMSVSTDKQNPGKFAFEVHNGFDLVEFGGNYPSQKDAEVAGQIAYRMLHLSNFKTPETPLQNDYMTDDELLAELGL